MNISKDTKYKAETKDGYSIKTGDILYWVDRNEIKTFKVKAWHNGKTAELDFLRYGKRYFCSMRGYGGAGVYPEKECSVFGFIPLSECYLSLEKAQSVCIRRLKLLILKAQQEPEYITKII